MQSTHLQNPSDSLIDRKAKYTCMGCRLKFETADLQRTHFKTEWHLYNLKRKVCKLDLIDLDSFNKIHSAATAASINSSQQLKPQPAIQHNKPPDTVEPQDDDAESEWEDEEVLDGDDLLDEDYDEDEAEAMLARVVKSDTCLFCDKKSNSISSNVIHMNLMHGFFIPEEQYVIDLDGLLEYLGFKVGAGCTCIWCNKQFSTLHGVRLHMVHKDHCKVYFNQEKAVEEFKEFYDYSMQEIIPMKSLSQIELPRRLNKQHSRRVAQHQALGNSDSRALVKAKTSSSSRDLVPKVNGTLQRTSAVYQAKKFNAARAKTLLRIGMTNNNAMRGRLRNQNPI